MSGEPPVWGGGAVDGPGWATLMAWTGLVLGAGALVFAWTAPLWGRPFGIVWIAGFGALAVWFGGVGWLRLRRSGPAAAWAGFAGVVLGVLAMALMAYAWTAFLAADAGFDWPMPPAWHPRTGPGDTPVVPGDVSI